MLDEYPTLQDLVMSLGRGGAENYVLDRVYYGTELNLEE